MTLMVIGGGGREHAIIKALRKNPRVDTIYALPGNAGIGQDAQCVGIKATDIDGICAFAREVKIDFAVVAPDDPLAMGAVDRLHALGIPCFGPTQKAAQIEASKIFAKDLMKKYHIPTAAYESFDDVEKAIEYARGQKYPLVVKADGLALGKGVVICQSFEEAERELRAFTDGHCVKPMISSMDHKRAHDGDTGLNTGGMGTIAPNPYYTPAVAKECMEKIFLPTIEAMREEGRMFKGCLYFGLMITPDGPRVIEYNCRFGDPETQVVLPLLKSDLLTIMTAVENGSLSSVPVEWSADSCCCVMIASGGYPEAYEKGKAIDLGKASEYAQVYHSGTALDDEGHLVTSGGRVLGLSATAPTLKEAVDQAYRAAGEVRFEGAFFRHDIGQRALNA